MASAFTLISLPPFKLATDIVHPRETKFLSNKLRTGHFDRSALEENSGKALDTGGFGKRLCLTPLV